MKSTIISSIALSLLMVGCGGGSSSSPKTSSSSSVVSSIALSSAALSSIAASSTVSSVATSQSSSLAAVATGVFLDGAVANIGYRTTTQQGSTNSNGEFNYRPGESITFFIGNLELPAVLAGAIITPMEIANTTNLSDTQLINILRLLQSLDADGNAANGIEITAAAIAAGAVLDFTLAPDVFAQSPAVKVLLQASGSANKELISAEQAIAHFQTTLDFINGPASSSASSVAESSSSASSDAVIVVPGSSASSAPVTESSSSASSVDVVGSSSSASSEAPVASSASSASSETSALRPANMEGFAAHAGVTGGAGGTVFTVTTGTELNAALCGTRTKRNPTPVIIYVNGTINHSNTTAQGCNTQADVIEIKETSNVSIIGVGTNALFDQIGIHVRASTNIIIQNVHVRNVKKSGSPTSNGGDAIGMESDVNRVWIDHNWLEASGGEKDGYDSLLDMKDGTTNVTVSYNKFNDSSRAGLIGSNDDPEGNNNITFHHNWYKNIEQRTPLIRNALVHVYNNYWANDSVNTMIHGINSRSNAKVLVESNYFYNTNNPLIASDDSPTPGCWQTNNDNTVLPTIYYSRSVGNGALVVPEVVNGQLQSTCAVTVPYTVTMDAANDVPAIVMANAGVGKIGNGGASSSSSQSSTVVVETSSSAAQSSSSVASSETVASSNSSASSVNSSEQSEASSSAAPDASVFYSEDFGGATASNFYTTYRVNGSGQSLYKKLGGTPVFADGAIGLTGARFSIGEAGKDLDLSKAYRLSFDVVQVSGSGKVQIFVDNTSTSGTTIFNQAANTIAAGQRLVVNSSMGTAASFIQIRAESSATLVLDNLTIEYTGAAGVSSSAASNANSSAGTNSSAGNTSSVSSSANVSSIASSSSSSAPYIPPSVNLSADCIRLATDSSVNWRDTALQTDQEIVECLSQSLGKPVGYGENAKGGFDPNGNSKLTIITKNSSVPVEQQLLDAITGEAHNWIVFDKVEFAQPHEIGMYRLGCSNATVQSILGATEDEEAECVNYQQWCAKNNVSESACVSTFFNTAMNKSNNPIRNPVIGSNKTIDGRMSEAYFIFSGFAIGKDSTGTPTQTANSVIMTHLRFKGAGHTEDHYCDPDMIRSTGASHDIWIHKNTFDTTGDSAFDVKVGAHNVTMSFNRLVNVKRAVLHGSSDSHTIDTQITTTMHHNAFVTTDDSYMLLGNTLRRVPLLRHGKTHMFNNVFVNYRKEILSLRVGASAQMEDSVFVVNAALQEKSSVAASLAEISTNYFKDISDGYFRNDRNFLWFGSGSCDLDNNTKTALTATNGAVTDLSANYNAASLNMINGWRFEAGQELVDYLSATAGKYGQVPFNSPLSGDRYYIAGLGKVPCQ